MASLSLLLCLSCKSLKEVSLPQEIPIITRSEWGARAPVLPMKEHTPSKITIHHTATLQTDKTLPEKLKGLQRFSQEQSTLADGRVKEPWADIPYHFYITAEGTIAEGRELKFAGDSNTPYDPTGHVLIVLEGNFQIEEVTAAQYQSLVQLTTSIARKWKIPTDLISGHKDYASTACPGDKLYALLPKIKSEVAAR